MKNLILSAVMALAAVAAAQDPAAVPATPLQPAFPKAMSCNPNAKPLPACPIESAVVKIEEKLHIGNCAPDQIDEVMQLVRELADRAKAQGGPAAPKPEGAPCAGKPCDKPCGAPCDGKPCDKPAPCPCGDKCDCKAPCPQACPKPEGAPCAGKPCGAPCDKTAPCPCGEGCPAPAPTPAH